MMKERQVQYLVTVFLSKEMIKLNYLSKFLYSLQQLSIKQLENTGMEVLCADSIQIKCALSVGEETL